MSDLEEVIDKFSGFISKEQADYILKNTEGASAAADPRQRKVNMTVKGILDSIKSKNSGAVQPIADESPVNVKDVIYRIFNPVNLNIRGREATKRIIILGEEGSTIPLNLSAKLSDFIDINSFERGDTVAVNNITLDHSSMELKSGQATIINRISPSKFTFIADYSTIKGEMRKVDMLGRVMEISAIRHVNRLGKPGQIAVASCTLSDSINTIDASFWGSSALLTANLKTNDFVKIEFCDVRMRNDRLQVYVNDDSRVVSSKIFAGRLLSKT